MDAQNKHMIAAIAQAKQAATRGEVPVGAIIVHNGQIIAEAGNMTEADHDATAHAEILAIRQASRHLSTPRLTECDLYVTLEPCPMCASAIALARVRRIYFGAYDPKGGGIDHGPRIFSHATCHHKPDVVGGMNEQECAELLKEFFKDLR